MLRAAIYLRASSEHQQYSTANQAAALMEYALGHELEIVHTFEDNGRSGLDLRRRPGLKALLNMALATPRPFDTLLVYDVSRWGRFQDTDEGAHYEFICRKAGVKVVYCAESFTNDGTGMSGLLKCMKRVMAAEYSRDLSRKVAAGKCLLASMGKQMGAAPIGLRRLLVDKSGLPKAVMQSGERKSLQTDRVLLVPGPPQEIALVNRLFHMFVHGDLREGQIAQALHVEGVPTPSQRGRWGHSAITKILQNEKYIGNLIYNRVNVKLGERRRTNPEEAWIRVNGVVEPIVDPALFELAQRKIAGRTGSEAPLLERLRALHARYGRLSRSRIDAEPGMPSSYVYMRRFGSLSNAYRLVGSPRSPGLDRERRRRREYSVEVLVAQLKDLAQRNGKLSRRIIDEDVSMATSDTYRRVFGSMAQAYAAVGYTPQDGCQAAALSKAAHPNTPAQGEYAGSEGPGIAGPDSFFSMSSVELPRI